MKKGGAKKEAANNGLGIYPGKIQFIFELFHAASL